MRFFFGVSIALRACEATGAERNPDYNAAKLPGAGRPKWAGLFLSKKTWHEIGKYGSSGTSKF